MKHTLHLEYKWSSDQPKKFSELRAMAENEGADHFSPKQLGSLTTQLDTASTSAPDAWGKLNFTTYATVTYDETQDKEIASRIPGGRSIPVPTH